MLNRLDKLKKAVETLDGTNAESISDGFDGIMTDFKMYKETLELVEIEGAKISSSTKNSLVKFLELSIAFYSIFFFLNVMHSICIKPSESQSE